MKAAKFDADGVAVRIMVAVNVGHFNTALKVGETWRLVPDDVARLEEVPPMEFLPTHPDLVEKT